MIHLSVRRLKRDHVEAVRAWLAQVETTRRDEAIATLLAEGVTHETAQLLETSDGPVLIYVMEADDIDRARAVGAASDAPIDAEHHAVMRAADDGPVPVETLLDVAP